MESTTCGGSSPTLKNDTHVPFMLRVPGVTDAGMRTSTLVELIDIFPSLTDLAGVKVPPLCADMLACLCGGRQCRSIAVRPQTNLEERCFLSIPSPVHRVIFYEEAVMGYAVRSDTYRFVEWYGFHRTSAKANWDDVWGTEHYNHTHPTKFFNDEK